MTPKESNKEFVIDVYICGEEITSNGVSKSHVGMVNFDYGNGCSCFRGDSSRLARVVTSKIGNHLRKNHGIESVRFNYPETGKNFQLTIDGYFGRPVFVMGALFVKPLAKRRQVALSKEINKINLIKDRWGKEVKLIT